jgi:hypothetical protein
MWVWKNVDVEKAKMELGRLRLSEHICTESKSGVMLFEMRKLKRRVII